MGNVLNAQFSPALLPIQVIPITVAQQYKPRSKVAIAHLTSRSITSWYFIVEYGLLKSNKEKQDMNVIVS